MTTVCKECGKDVSDGRNHTCRPKQKTPEEMAEEYCDRPRCAQMTRNDKAWHRTKAAYLEAYHAGYQAGYDAAGNELERERMRLAACGVAAMSNTEESVKERINPDNPYYSASYRDVCDAVDREMQWKAVAEEWERDYDKLKEKYEPMIAIISEENP